MHRKFLHKAKAVNKLEQTCLNAKVNDKGCSGPTVNKYDSTSSTAGGCSVLQCEKETNANVKLMGFSFNINQTLLFYLPRFDTTPVFDSMH